LEQLLGENFFPLLTLALGAALAGGNIAAFIKPPPNLDEGSLEAPRKARSFIQIAIGLVACLWALATLAG
jgi:hypothetical protein